jgi:hypothetical protein
MRNTTAETVLELDASEALLRVSPNFSAIALNIYDAGHMQS